MRLQRLIETNLEGNRKDITKTCLCNILQFFTAVKFSVDFFFFFFFENNEYPQSMF